jgi:uncharacterized protein YlxW (UPF0749 family)
LQGEIKQIDKKVSQFKNLIQNSENEIKDFHKSKNSDLERLEDLKSQIKNSESNLQN